VIICKNIQSLRFSTLFKERVFILAFLMSSSDSEIAIFDVNGAIPIS
tara:strand:- start:1545 stop:1685 length:141 start_codon:yes stop_codon:yes gene_type:complete